MPWSLNKEGAVFYGLTNSEQNKYDAFQNAVHNQGMHPKEAAALAGDTDYKLLSGGHNQYQIRLSQGTRCTFIQDNIRQEVQIIQVGGHT